MTEKADLALALHCAILGAMIGYALVWHEPAFSGYASAYTSEEPYERTASD